MQFERRLVSVDGSLFDTLDALLDGPFALCRFLLDEAGSPVDYRFVRVSRHFEEMTGFAGVEGRTVREVAPDVEDRWIEHYARVAFDGVPSRFEDESVVTGRRYVVHAAPVEPRGSFVMHFRDVSEHRHVEEERVAALSRAQHLLRELGHRVMNSFASISAILAMETRAAPPEARAALERVQGRVQALAALYRRLDGAPQMERVDASDYLQGNVRSFRDSIAAGAGVEVSCELAPLMLSAKAAVPLGLAVNELLTRAVGRLVAPSQGARIRVTLTETAGHCRIDVAEEGGFGTDEPIGIGPALVAAFVGELGGEISTVAAPGGSVTTLTFRVAPEAP